MATQRLSNVLSHLTPGQKPLDKMYVFERRPNRTMANKRTV